MDIQALATLLVAGAIGIGMIAFGVWLTEVGKMHVQGSLTTHFGGALVVAGVMGVTYELLMDRRRNRHHEAQIADIKMAVLQSIAGLTQFSAAKLFALLQDVARNLDRTPTLFRPARPASECPFSSNPQYFDAVIDSAREDMLKAVQSWLRDSNENLRFLGSDFVGKYRIRDFAAEMRLAADAEWLSGRWHDPLYPDKTRQWVLNYYWALSALDDNELQTLRGLLTTAQDEFTRKWILHVPLQMPEMKGVEGLVDDFLKRCGAGPTDSRRKRMSAAEAQAAILAIAAIERHDRTDRGDNSGRGLVLLKAHRESLVGYRSFIARTWVGMPLDEKNDLPPEDVVRPYTISSRNDDQLTLLDPIDNSQITATIIRPGAMTPAAAEPSTARLVGTTDANGKFVPLYGEMHDGAILHLKA